MPQSLKFLTKSLADAAQAKISENMQCPRVAVDPITGMEQPNCQKTERWAVPQQGSDGFWYFLKPPTDYMPGVLGWVEVTLTGAAGAALGLSF